MDAAMTGDGLQGATPAMMLGLRDELIAATRKQTVSLAVVLKSKGLPPTSPAPQPASAGSAKGTTDVRGCINDMARTAKSKFAEQDIKLAAILDLCRPEIEAAARAAFVGSNSTLEEVRQKAFMDAKAMAEIALER